MISFPHIPVDSTWTTCGVFASLFEFGDRDHTTVPHSPKQVDKQMRTDPAFAEKVKEITTNINSKK